ncbi:MAG: LEA type 2 family protein [Bacteroidota bacterium]
MLKKIFYFQALICSLLLFSCKNLSEITVTDVNNFSINKLSMKEIEGEIGLTIKNPNSVGFSIYRSEFDIIYGDVKLGKAKLHKRVHIGANAEKSYTFKLKSNPENLNLTDILKLANTGGSGTIQIKGDLKVGKLFIKRKYPINYIDKVNLQK